MATPLRKMTLAAVAVSLAAAGLYVIHDDGPAAAAVQPAARPAPVDPAPSAATTLSSTTVPIRDQARARRFYVDQLGFTVVRETAGRLEVVPAGGAGGSTVVLSTQSGMQPGSATGLFWSVADCPSAVAAIRASGVVIQDCADAPPGLFADFADPDGNLWTVFTSFAGGYANGTVANVGLPVSDQDRSLAFYATALGFTVVEDKPNPEPYPGRYIELVAPGGGTHIALTACSDTAVAGSRSGLALGTTDVAGTIKDLQSRGVPVDASGAFTDPDGNDWTVVPAGSAG